MTDNVNTTEAQRQAAKESQILIVTILETIEKQEGMRYWKYKVIDNRNNKFLLQTGISPEELLPIILKVGNKYIIPIRKNQSGTLGYLDGEHLDLLSDYEEGIVSTVPLEEQAGSKEQIDKITEGDTPYFYHDSGATLTNKDVKPLVPKPKYGDTKAVQAEVSLGTGLITANDKDQFQVMDQKDEQQILSEIKGHMIDEYVYQFDMKVGAGTRLVTGVSYAGIKALISRRGGYAITNNTIVEVNGIWYAKAMVHDKQQDIDGLGLGECSMQEPFARQKAMSKALRNAYRSVLDEGQFKAFALQWLKENKK